MADAENNGGIDFAAIGRKMDAERNKLATMTPEERNAYKQQKEEAANAEYRANNEKENTRIKSKYRQNILEGHVIGPIEISGVIAHYSNPLITDDNDRMLKITGKISNTPPTENPEKDYKNANKFSLILPEDEVIKLTETHLKNNDYNKETYAQAPYSARSDEKLYIPVQRSSRKYNNTGLEYNFGENKWPDLPIKGKATPQKSATLESTKPAESTVTPKTSTIATPAANNTANTTTTPTPVAANATNATTAPAAPSTPPKTPTTSNTALILIAPASNEAEDAKTLIQKTNAAIKANPQYANIRIIGHNQAFAQKIADDLQVLNPRLRTGALTFSKFRTMEKEQQAKTIEYIDQKTDILTHNNHPNIKQLLVEKLTQEASIKAKQNNVTR